jgi:hypothetical protein
VNPANPVPAAVRVVVVTVRGSRRVSLRHERLGGGNLVGRRRRQTTNPQITVSICVGVPRHIPRRCLVAASFLVLPWCSPGADRHSRSGLREFRNRL